MPALHVVGALAKLGEGNNMPSFNVKAEYEEFCAVSYEQNQ
jgi:hypothetical protein